MNRKINYERGFTKILTMIFIVLLFILSIGMVTDTVSANKEIDTIKIVVKKGDSLWTIAEKHHNNKIDIRKLTFQIKELNEISDTIHPGQVIYIPLQ